MGLTGATILGLCTLVGNPQGQNSGEGVEMRYLQMPADTPPSVKEEIRQYALRASTNLNLPKARETGRVRDDYTKTRGQQPTYQNMHRQRR